MKGFKMKGFKMGFLMRLLLPFAVRIVSKVAKKITPELRKDLGDFIMAQDKKAKATPNQFDDIFWDAIRRILGI
jgi:hypothetical protein